MRTQAPFLLLFLMLGVLCVGEHPDQQRFKELLVKLIAGVPEASVDVSDRFFPQALHLCALAMKNDYSSDSFLIPRGETEFYGIMGENIEKENIITQTYSIHLYDSPLDYIPLISLKEYQAQKCTINDKVWVMLGKFEQNIHDYVLLHDMVTHARHTLPSVDPNSIWIQKEKNQYIIYPSTGEQNIGEIRLTAPGDQTSIQNQNLELEYSITTQWVESKETDRGTILAGKSNRKNLAFETLISSTLITKGFDFIDKHTLIGKALGEFHQTSAERHQHSSDTKISFFSPKIPSLAVSLHQKLPNHYKFKTSLLNALVEALESSLAEEEWFSSTLGYAAPSFNIFLHSPDSKTYLSPYPIDWDLTELHQESYPSIGNFYAHMTQSFNLLPPQRDFFVSLRTFNMSYHSQYSQRTPEPLKVVFRFFTLLQIASQENNIKLDLLLPELVCLRTEEEQIPSTRPELLHLFSSLLLHDFIQNDSDLFFLLFTHNKH